MIGNDCEDDSIISLIAFEYYFYKAQKFDSL
jgi:hypothetical protein